MSKNWIQSSIKRPGALRKQLNIPEGKTIPRERLLKIKKRLEEKAKREKLTKEELTLLRRINLALSLMTMSKKKKRSRSRRGGK